jgi:hypothetical protein
VPTIGERNEETLEVREESYEETLEKREERAEETC